MPEAVKRILVAPLDWGLGHAARCIPIIRALLQRQHEVVVASSGGAAALLQSEFPQLTHYGLPGYNPVYPKGGFMIGAMAVQLPGFIHTISAEHAITEKLVKTVGIDVVISDNRYGCYSQRVPSIFITHQVRVLMPRHWQWMEGPLNGFNQRKISRFSACWIPADDNRLFPQLMSGREKIPHHFIGYLSRMNAMALPSKYHVLAICSGPEPQRSIFEKLVTAGLQRANFPSLVVRGVLNTPHRFSHAENQMTVLNHLDSEGMNKAIAQSDVVLSRSGYSTVMDLMRLGKRAIFVPTPGQTEQEYLAEVLHRQQVAFSTTQQNFDLKKALAASTNCGGFQNFEPNQLLHQAIDSMI